MKKKPVYSGVFLGERAMNTLRAWFRQETGLDLLPNAPKDPHLTVTFRPPVEEVVEMPLGYDVKLTVTGWVADGMGQALTVTGFHSDGIHPHVTLATASGVSPAYSKDLLVQSAVTKVHGPTVEGTVGYFDGAVQFKIPDE